MYLEIRRSGPIAPVCQTCGATELMYQGQLPLRLDMLKVVREYPWWRPIARRRERIMRERILEAWHPVIDLTRLPLHSESDHEQDVGVDRS